jgi:SOS-response transcriptional repressor LexA
MLITDADMLAIGKLIKAKRTAKGFSARQLADMVGVSDAHIIYIEKGQRRPAFDKLTNIIVALGMSVESVLELVGSQGPDREGTRRLSRVPVISWVKAGAWTEASDPFEPGDADEWLETDVPGDNAFCLRVAGDSMEPEFHEGEIIIIDPHQEPLPNDFIVVKNPDGEVTFKQLKKYGRSWVLHPLNPRYEDQEVKRGEFRIIGKVVKKEKRY